MRITDTDISVITKEIKEKIFTPASQYKTSIFLCGASLEDKSTMRYKISKLIEDHFWRSWFEIIYPEVLFENIIYRKDTSDIQNLETMLAESVDVIIICPESPGSFTELGAFSHDERLKNKIVCIQKLKFKKSKSYINTGPVKILNKSKTSQVIYVSDIITNKEKDKIRYAIKKIKKESPASKEKINLLELENFVIPCIYLFDPISRENLIEIVSHAMNSEKFGQSGTIACLNQLSSKNLVIQTQHGISLSEAGLNRFQNFIKSNKKYSKGLYLADKLRLEIMNLKYRNKNIAWTKKS